WGTTRSRSWKCRRNRPPEVRSIDGKARLRSRDHFFAKPQASFVYNGPRLPERGGRLMKRRALSVAVLSLAVAWVMPAGEPASEVHKVELDGHTFTLPVGFEIELVAGPPLVNRPITADFDEQGRLYVADSSGSNEKVEVQLKTKPHRIVRLEDADGD